MLPIPNRCLTTSFFGSLSEISTILLMRHAGGPPHGPPGPPGPGPHLLPEWAVMPWQGNHDDGRPGDGMMPGEMVPYGPGGHGHVGPGHGSRPDAFYMVLGAGTLGAFIALLTVYVAKKASRKSCRSRAATPANEHFLPVGLAAPLTVDGKYMQTNTGAAMAYCPMA
jgi:hypothetical protein